VKASAFTRVKEFHGVIDDAEAEELVAQLGVRLEQLVEILEGARDLFVPSLEQRVDRAARLLTEHVWSSSTAWRASSCSCVHSAACCSAWRRRHAWKNVPMREIIGLGTKT